MAKFTGASMVTLMTEGLMSQMYQMLSLYRINFAVLVASLAYVLNICVNDGII